MIVFEQVDISIVVEKQVGDTPVPLPLVLRSVNSKSTFQVTEVIQNGVAQTIDDGYAPMIGVGDNQLLINLGLVMPQWLRLFVMRAFILRNPDRMQKTMGTVMVTSLGTVGHVPSWIMPTSIHPLSIGIGTLTKKPYWVQGKIQPRKILHLTLSMDHDIIDGMPARKFVADLVQRLNQGYALCE